MARRFALPFRLLALGLAVPALFAAPSASAALWRVDDAATLAPGACAIEAAVQTAAGPDAAALFLCGIGNGEWAMGRVRGATGATATQLQWKQTIQHRRDEPQVAVALVALTDAGTALDEWSGHAAARIPLPDATRIRAHANFGLVRVAGEPTRPQAGFGAERALDQHSALIAEWHRVATAPATIQLGLRRVIGRLTLDIYAGSESGGPRWLGLAVTLDVRP